MATVKAARKIEPTAKAQKADLSVVESAPEEAPPKPKRKWFGRLTKWLLLLLLLGGAAAGGWWYYMKSQPAPAAPNVKGKASVAVAKTPPKPPQFVNLEPFTVNLLGETAEHYLQVAIVFQVSDDKAGDNIKLYMPMIRDRILRLLSGMRPADLLPPAGKQQLAERIIAESRASLPGDAADKGIVNAFFASFVIQ